MIKSRSRKIKFYFFVAFIFILIVIPIISYLTGYENFLNSRLNSLYSNFYFPLIFIVLFIISSFFPLPFLTFLGATVFPFGEAVIYSLIGNFFSFIILFYIARWLGKDYLDRYIQKKPKLLNIKKGLEKNSFTNIIMLRFFYIIPPEFPSIIGGVSNMKFKKYIFSSMIGAIPLTIASIMLIQSSAGESQIYFIFSIISMILLILIPIFYLPILKELIPKYKRKK